MKRNLKKLLIWQCVLCLSLVSVACKQQDEYQPALYTKEEVQYFYLENTELFENVVRIISSNKTFYEKGRINEHTDADIISPYDDDLSLFSDNDRNTINELFELKPYMILYDYTRRFVSVTFISEDANSSYVLLFWTFDGEESEDKFNDYKKVLSQKYTLEELSKQCIMYYDTSISSESTESDNNSLQLIFIYEPENSFVLSDEQAEYLSSVWDDDEWYDGLTKTLCTFKFHSDDIDMRYSSEAGVFNDDKNQRYMIVSKEQRDYINSFVIGNVPAAN